jgi:chemotaxis methyl-accepting protein methylase
MPEAPRIESVRRSSHRSHVPAARAIPEVHVSDEWLRLLERSGVDPAAYKTPVLARRFNACLRVLGVASPEAAAKLAFSKPALLKHITNTVLLGVTSFFRDPQVWTDLEAAVLPVLGLRSKVRVLSAGCSEGHELFSMGMLLAEHGYLNKSCLTGWDCRATPLEIAERGIYPATVLNQVPESRWKYFQNFGSSVRVIQEIRAAAEWRVQSILHLADAEFWDIIFFRNVAIYLNENVAYELWTALARALAPGGFLVTGKAEKPLAGLGLTRVASCIYRKGQMQV